MKIVEIYRLRAEECEEIANQSLSAAHRKSILEIARSWRELADQRERMLKNWCDFQRRGMKPRA
jgi:hypothetical protein